MSETSKDFREARERYRPLLERALIYFLEDEGAARRVASSALEQAARQWAALEGEANMLHLIGLAAEDQCKLLLPRSILFIKRKPNPTATQIIRHLEWYDWEQRIETLRNEIERKRASGREAGAPALGSDEADWLSRRLDAIGHDVKQAEARPDDTSWTNWSEIEPLERRLEENVLTVLRSQLGISDDDENAAGGIACPVPVPPPMRGPGDRREFAEALAAPRNP